MASTRLLSILWRVAHPSPPSCNDAGFWTGGPAFVVELWVPCPRRSEGGAVGYILGSFINDVKATASYLARLNHHIVRNAAFCLQKVAQVSLGVIIYCGIFEAAR